MYAWDSPCKEKFQDLKRYQSSSSSSSHPITSKDNFYARVLGADKPGHVQGVGTCPTPSSLSGYTSNKYLKVENKMLNDRVKELEDRFARMENMIGGNLDKQQGSLTVVASSVASMHKDVDLIL